ncbi:putative serine esterase (DUF676) [Fragilaria crotonensis]|nr:putative serine esterase (DUF676) [Fragilaria crotonensis]
MKASGLAIADQAPRVATHLVILIHGLHGNEKELGYLEESITRQSLNDNGMQVILHSAKCNLGRTLDGIANGGDRLVHEVEAQIRANVQGDSPLYLSFIGNSLGGLYARYAIAHLDMTTGNIVPCIFCTTLAPHLGVANHTYVPLFRWTEIVVSGVFGATGSDLFLRTPLLQEMGTSAKYLAPLRRFRKRIAVANAFGTDFQVPPTTAAFLSKRSNYLHHRLPNKKSYVLSVKTEPTESYDQEDMSQCLDALGWTKVFLDVRREIPLPSIPLPFGQDTTMPSEKMLWPSHELQKVMTRSGRIWTLPMGHMVSCANSRDGFNRWFNANGRPFMDQLAQDLLEGMVESMNLNLEECEIEG